MDFKNASILLIFLLCILGLIIGVHYTEVGDKAPNLDDYDEAVHEDSNKTNTTELELKEKTENTLEKFFT